MGDLFASNGELSKDPQLDLTSRTFNPRKFIRKTLGSLSHSDFERELEQQISAAQENSGEALKQLIKDNLGVFIDSKDAMSAVYQTDRELFTGEALEGVSETFHAASEACKALVEPTLVSYHKIQRNHFTQELLEKMYTVLRVPGTIYEYCGVYVAARRSTEAKERKGRSTSAGKDNAEKNDGVNTSSDEEEEEEEESEEDKDAATRRGGGALEADMAKTLVDTNDTVHTINGTTATHISTAELQKRYITHFDDEEVFLWYDTPLVRLRDAESQRHRVEERSNYEAAVLHLRRAMLYLEENYNLEDGTMLGVEEEEEEEEDKGEGGKEVVSNDKAQHEGENVANNSTTQSMARASTSLQRSEGVGNTAAAVAVGGNSTALVSHEEKPRSAGRGVFIRQFATALLKAALYLVNQLAEELTYVNAADTVFIEDVLSMMMDVTIATVKLRHFAFVLQHLMHPDRPTAVVVHESNVKDKPKNEGGGEEEERHEEGDGAAEKKLETKTEEEGRGDSDNDEGNALTALRNRLERNRARIIDQSDSDDEEDDEEDGGGDVSSIAEDLMAADASWQDSFTNKPPQGLPESALQANTPLNDESHLHISNSMNGGNEEEYMGAALHNSEDDQKRPIVRLMQHPAQYYIGLTRNQHTKLMLSSASALLQEAQDWHRKAATLDTHGTSSETNLSNAAQGDGNVTSSERGREGGNVSSSSLLGAALQAGNHTDGLLGNIQDSFVAQPTITTTRSNTSSSVKGVQPALGLRYSDDQAALTAANALSFIPANVITPVPTQEVDKSEESNARMLLYAFRTPEMDFALDTTFVLGTMDMAAVLESSALQIRLHSRALLQQLDDRGQAASAVMSQAGQLTSYALRLAEACMGNLEHVLVSYWGGIATAIHGGVFDFQPASDSVLYRMLTGDAILGSVAQQGKTLLHKAGPSSSTHVMSPSKSAVTPIVHTTTSNTSNDALPPVYFLPVLADALRGDTEPSTTASPLMQNTNNVSTPKQQQAQSQQASLMASFASQSRTTVMTLRELSVAAVRRMIHSAATTMEALFVAFVNRTVIAGFVRGLAGYTHADVQHTNSNSDDISKESVELHAAVLFEVVLAQWERMMSVVNEAVLHVKIAVGESCASASATMQVQVDVVNALLAELEQLRTRCMRCYLHGMGMLAKIYLTLLPALQKRVDRTSLEHRVRARLSRDYVSSSLPNKLLNVLAVMADRTVAFLQRDAEVFDSADLFAAKAEQANDEDNEAEEKEKEGESSTTRRRPGLRHRLLRRRGSQSQTRSQTRMSDPERRNNDNNELPQSSVASSSAVSQRQQSASSKHDATSAAVVDPVTQYVATAHSRLVQDHLAEHEELLQALFSNVLLCFIDMLHLKCQSVCGDDAVPLADRESVIVECMADALAIPTTVAPILLDHLLQPGLFELLVRYRSVNSNVQEQRLLVDQKRNQFTARYLVRLGEHCQLAVDAMLGMYLSVPQQQIAMLVRRAGFTMPLFDWQRASGHLTAAVRPYLADCIACIATAQETLHWIHQPALGAAATQRLVADLALSFVTATTANVNAFELSAECSADFMLYGTLLLEAEGQTILGLIDSILAVGTSNNTTSGNTPNSNTSSNTQVLPELVLARAGLQNLVQALITSSSAACTALGLRKRTSTSPRNTTAQTSVTPAEGSSTRFASLDERDARRAAMVTTALAELRYMITAVSSHLEESSLATSSSLGLLDREAMQTIAERLSKRKEGYQLQHATASTRTTTGAGTTLGKRVTVLHGNKRKAEVTTNKEKATADTTAKQAATNAEAPKAKNTEEEGGETREAQNERAAALYQHAVKEGAKVTKRRVRKTTTTTTSVAQQQQGSEVHPVEATNEAVTGEGEGSAEKPAIRQPHRRVMRRAAVVPVLAPSESRAVLSEDRPVRERRVNRFKRTNVV